MHYVAPVQGDIWTKLFKRKTLLVARSSFGVTFNIPPNMSTAQIFYGFISIPQWETFIP